MINTNKEKYLFIAPALIFVIVFFIAPNLMNFYYAFTNWNTYSDNIIFTGLQNFKELIKEGRIWKDIIITFKFAITFTLVNNLFSLLVALAIEKTNRHNGFLRSLFFIPVLISSLATGYLFKGILDPKGPLNLFLGSIINSEVTFPWLGSLTWTIFIVALITVWKGSGLSILIYIAGLSTIPEELIESAKIDGANYWRIVKNIKIPLIGPAFTYNIVLNFIGSLYVFDLVVSTTGGGPARQTEVLNIFIWNIFAQGRYGYATLVSMILFFIVAPLGVILAIILRKREIEL